jgi:hypothetical protein
MPAFDKIALRIGFAAGDFDDQGRAMASHVFRFRQWALKGAGQG